MFEEFQRVHIKGTDVFGYIVDITEHVGTTICLVESDTYSPVGDEKIIEKYCVYNHGYPLYSCTEAQLEGA